MWILFLGVSTETGHLGLPLGPLSLVSGASQAPCGERGRGRGPGGGLAAGCGPASVGTRGGEGVGLFLFSVVTP